MRLFFPLVGGLGLALAFYGAAYPHVKGSAPRSTSRRRVEQVAALKSISIAVLVGSSAALLVGAMTGSPMAALVSAALGAASPTVLARRGTRVSARKRRQAWPDALALMIAMIRSGSSLAEACVALAHRGPDELQPGFLEFTSTYRATANFKSAVASVRDALQDPIADRVLVALLLANEVGGNDLVNLLSSICNAVREDLRVRDEVEARWSWNIAAARVAAGAPVVVLLLMSTQPQAASAYGSAGGITVIAMCALATAIGYLLMLRAARLPEERRLR